MPEADDAQQVYRYKAFISYSHADERWARWLHKHLEGFQLPTGMPAGKGLTRRPLRPVFRDRDELASSSDLDQALLDALGESENLIVICSAASARSRWVNAEVEAFLAMGRGDAIFPIATEAFSDELLPPALANAQLTPIAADLVADGRRNALLKIVAGILRIRFDDLRGRAELRRRKRLLAITALSTTGFLLTSALAAYALYARAAAEEARLAAEESRETAQQVTRFIVGILEKANPTNRNPDDISIREVLDQGYETANVSLADKPRVRASVLTAIANAYNTLGLFEDNVSINRDVLKAVRSSAQDQHSSGGDPELGRALINYANSLGNLDTAESNRQADEMFLQAVAYVEALQPPDFYLLGSAHIGMGIQHQYSNRIAPAREQFRLAIEALGRMPDPDYDKLAWANQNLGTTWLRNDAMTVEGVNLAQRQFQIAADIITKQNLSNDVLASTVALNLAASHLLLNQPAEARSVVEPALAKLEALFDAHPRVVYATRLLGNAAALEDDYELAGYWFDRAYALAEGVEGGARDQLLGVITTYRGRLAQQQDGLSEADAYYREAFRLFGSPDDPHNMLPWLDDRVERYPLERRP